MSGVQHATLGTAEAEGRIVDDDPMPRVRLAVASPDPARVTEDGGTVPVTIIGRLEGARRSADVGLTLSLTALSAGAGDFTTASAELTIAAGQLAGAVVLEFTPVADTEVEGDETVQVGSTTVGVDVIPTVIVIADDDDTTAPALSAATVESDTMVLTYDEPLDQTSVPAADAFSVAVAGTDRGVDAVAVAGARVALTLASAVSVGDTVTVSYAVPASGSIRDRAGNAAAGLSDQTVTRGTGPVVDRVWIVARALGVPYGPGDTLRLRVLFSEAVEITGGAPLLSLDVGDQRRSASYDASTSQGSTIEFTYQVQPGDRDDDGVSIDDNSLSAPDGVSIADGDGNDADLSHAGYAARPHNQVDGVPPTLASAVIDLQTLVLTFSEALDSAAVPDGTAFSVSVGGAAGTAPASVAVSGTVVTLRGPTKARPGDAVTVSYDVPAAGGLRDPSGNEVGSLAAHVVTNRTLATNSAPLAGNREVTTLEDTAYAFQASDFGFFDGDPDDELASVTVVTLPGVGSLTLGGTAVTAGDVVSVADLDAGGLLFTPAANDNGSPYATFTFRVNDGAHFSLLAYPMTIAVTAVADPATGAPVISGTPQERKTLTVLTSGIVDGDGTTKAEAGSEGYAYQYTWFRIVSETETEITEADASTYVLTNADVGAQIRVQVSFTDDQGGSETLSSAKTEAVAARPTVPARPASFAATAVDGGVALSWTPPADTGGSPITKYQYRVSNDGGTTWDPDWTDVPDGTDAGYRPRERDRLHGDRADRRPRAHLRVAGGERRKVPACRARRASSWARHSGSCSLITSRARRISGRSSRTTNSWRSARGRSCSPWPSATATRPTRGIRI